MYVPLHLFVDGWFAKRRKVSQYSYWYLSMNLMCFHDRYANADFALAYALRRYTFLQSMSRAKYFSRILETYDVACQYYVHLKARFRKNSQILQTPSISSTSLFQRSISTATKMTANIDSRSTIPTERDGGTESWRRDWGFLGRIKAIWWEYSTDKPWTSAWFPQRFSQLLELEQGSRTWWVLHWNMVSDYSSKSIHS